MARYNIHAGHGISGGQGCGAMGILDESLEARKVKEELIRLMKSTGHIIYDCTFNGNASPTSILSEIVNKCNQHKVDLDISIHLNSGRNDYGGDTSTGGVEVYGYNNDTAVIGSLICQNISTKLNIRNRGFKINKNLYVLNSTKSNAILIECCFVDDKDDADRWNATRCAEAIYTALTGKEVIEITSEQPRFTSSLHYRVHIEDKGWDDVHQSGEIAGTVGQSKRVEALKIDWPNHDVYAKAHIQSIGWKDYGKITSDTVIGTVGQALRLECLCLKGNFRYRVHIQHYGWSAWTKADGVATLGTVGQALRIEAIQIEELQN